MTIPTLHPGVYVQELPSGVRAITGVATRSRPWSAAPRWAR